ncbi:MAG: ABC transporter ATP-binding protein [Acidimicrobiales bacterium]|nr:ABC transporter ATP-binding protein [Acidimicrobiales bacterium]
MRPAVYATGVTVEVGGTRLVGPADLTVGVGDWVNIIGPNGAGKTTLLRAVCGLQAASGRVDIGGRPLAQMSRRARSRHIGYVPQQPVMPAGMTIEQYVLLGRSPHVGTLGSESPHDFAAVATTLNRLDLTTLAHRTLDKLSGGERQRANIARALAQEPKLLLLDEPTTALDIGHQQDVLELIDDQRWQLGLTVVSTMHDLTLAARYGDNLVLLADGIAVADGPPIQVLTGPHLSTHYGAHVDVIEHDGSLVVVPIRQSTNSTGASDA